MKNCNCKKETPFRILVEQALEDARRLVNKAIQDSKDGKPLYDENPYKKYARH